MSKMKTILIFDPAESPGGSISRATELSIELRQFKFIIMTYKPLKYLVAEKLPFNIKSRRILSIYNPHQAYSDKEKIQNIIKNKYAKKILIGMIKVLLNLNKIFVLMQAVFLTLFEKIDLIQSNNGIHFLPYRLAKFKNATLIYYFRDLQYFKNYPMEMINEASNYIFVGKNLMQEYLKQLDLNKKHCSVIHSPFNVNQRIKREKISDLSLIHKLKKENKKIIICSNRICYEKGQHIVLAAFKVIVKKNSNVTLIFLGKEEPNSKAREYYFSLKEYVKNNHLDESVFFLGYRKDVLNITQLADIAIQAPIYFEALSGSMIESLQLGIPTISSSIGGATEAIVHNKTGFLFPPKDTDSLISLLERILNDSINLKEISTAGQKYTQEKWNLEVIKEKITEIYISSH